MRPASAVRTPAPAAVVAAHGGDTSGPSDSRRLLLAGLAVLTLALAGGLLTANLARADRLGLGG